MRLSLGRLLAATAVLGSSGCFKPNPLQLDETDGSSGFATGTGEPTGMTEATSGEPTATSEAGSQGDSDDGTSTGPGESSGQPTECEPDAGVCTRPAPFCIDSVCQPCSEVGGDDFCAGEAMGERCHPAGGSCEACVEDGHCNSNSCADGYNCVGCDAHSDCPDSACDLADGTCIDTTLQFWVDGTDCGPPGPPSSDPGFGSENQPYCWLTTALDQVAEGQSAVIRLAGAAGSQPEVDVSDRPNRTLALLGEGGALGDTATPLTVGNGNRVFVSEISVENASVAGLTCDDGGSLWISDSEVRESATGVLADGCVSLVVERSQIQQSSQSAIDARSSDIRVVSSMLVRNGETGTMAYALRSDDSTFDLRYSTLVGNLGADARASIYCTGSGGGTVRNSILLSPSSPSVDCPIAQFSTNAVDTRVDGAANATIEDYDLTWFVDLTGYDARLAGTDNPFDGVARWGENDPRTDYTGARRLAYDGLSEFAGAHQP